MAQWGRIHLQCRSRKRHGSIEGSGRSPGGGHGNPLQYSCQKNPMDRTGWWVMVCGITESGWTKQLSRASTQWRKRPRETVKREKSGQLMEGKEGQRESCLESETCKAAVLTGPGSVCTALRLRHDAGGRRRGLGGAQRPARWGQRLL